MARAYTLGCQGQCAEYDLDGWASERARKNDRCAFALSRRRTRSRPPCPPPPRTGARSASRLLARVLFFAQSNVKDCIALRLRIRIGWREKGARRMVVQSRIGRRTQLVGRSIGAQKCRRKKRKQNVLFEGGCGVAAAKQIVVVKERGQKGGGESRTNVEGKGVARKRIRKEAN